MIASSGGLGQVFMLERPKMPEISESCVFIVRIAARALKN
jgi:hypothetical protein